MDIYTVTFCTQDQDVGANFLWHTFIYLSRFDQETQKMEVMDTWGFYGSPSTNTRSLLHSLKMLLALDVDFYGNHGKLRHEDVRYLDTGLGLHGVTFELTKEKYDTLQARCVSMCENEFEAIQDLAGPLNLKGKPLQRTRNYPQESQSRLFFELEAAAAAEQRRSPRLKEFQLSPLPGANTCKAQSIKLLDGIIEPEQITRVKGWFGSISRFSGKMENIYLHSTGPLREHKKSSGEIVHYRSIDDEGVRLFWSVPPQEVELQRPEVLGYFQISPAHCHEVKKLVSQLQRFEWYFINATFDEKLKPYQEHMITTLQIYYQSFSILTPKPVKKPGRGCSDTLLSWMFKPEPDKHEKELIQHIEASKLFLESMGVVMMTDFTEDEQIKLDDVSVLDHNIELLVRYFPEQKQRELCNIIDINFDARESDYDLPLAM